MGDMCIDKYLVDTKVVQARQKEEYSHTSLVLELRSINTWAQYTTIRATQNVIF